LERSNGEGADVLDTDSLRELVESYSGKKLNLLVRPPVPCTPASRWMLPLSPLSIGKLILQCHAHLADAL
jgi:hypothetical protein